MKISGCTGYIPVKVRKELEAIKAEKGCKNSEAWNIVIENYRTARVIGKITGIDISVPEIFKKRKRGTRNE